MTTTTIAGILASLAAAGLFVSLSHSAAPTRAEGVQPPKVEFKITSRVLAGEPIFLQCGISNPNDVPITIGFTPSYRTWLKYVLETGGPVAVNESQSPHAEKPRAPVGDELRAANVQPIPPHETYVVVVPVGIVSESSGSHDVHASAAITFKAGSRTEESMTGSIPAPADERLDLTVEWATPEALAAAALRIGHAISPPGNGAIAPGFDPNRGGGDGAFDAWMAMPAAACAGSWRAVLLGEHRDAHLASAAHCLANRTEPEAKALLADILRYADAKGPKVSQAVRAALAPGYGKPKGGRVGD